MGILKDELGAVADKYGDDRRTEITAGIGSFDVEDLIVEEDMVITVSHQGYVKRLPVDTYRAQRRGGRGLRGMGTKDEDWVEHLFVASTHDYLMIFTRRGQCYWLKVWEVPVGNRPRLHGQSKYGMWNRVFVALYDTFAAAILALQNGDVDGVIIDGTSAAAYEQEFAGELTIGITGLQADPLGLVFQEGDGMVDAFNEGLAAIKADGTHDALVAKYWGPEQ